MAAVRPTNLDDLIDRQVRLWEARDRLAAEGGESARREFAHLDQGPWITISKQAGSGGEALGRAVAEALGWHVFDREILISIASNAHLRERLVSRLDERAVSGLTDYVTHLFAPEFLSRGAFVRELIDVLMAIARQGNAVLVGRGANWMLNPKYGLRVRVVGPVEARVAHVAERHGLALAEARERVETIDRQTRAFIRQVFDRDIDDPLGYDMILNTGAMSEQAAVEVLRSALHAKLGGATR